jgi:predicted Rossmann-fold nucleotide-binding protein
MENPLIVGVMGEGAASPQDTEDAYRLGSLIAEQGWILLNGGSYREN